MNKQPQLFDLLASVLSYPDQNYCDTVLACGQFLDESNPKLSGELGRFTAFVKGAAVEKLEELFTRTFDLNPVCCLEVGWQLYGEDYNRGSFMVKMRQQMRAHDVPESIELPDHLANLLRLLGRMEPDESGPLCASYLLPAMAKMQSGLEGEENPYEEVLSTVRQLLELLAAGYPRPAEPLIHIRRKEEVIHV
jgi:nitrate reductase delta subunit